ESNVIFRNRFVTPREMVELIGAADIYITPYKHKAQVVSGTLAYALGAGKAIISTPYLHAIELLDDERGTLVPFDDPEAIAAKTRSEEHTSELQSRSDLVCRLLLEKKKKTHKSV